MLGKLLKYEFKSLMNNLGVLYLVWLSLTLITAVLPKASKYTSEFVENLLHVVWVISFIAAIIMTLVVVIDRRFYKNFYGAEGYFTLSLPVKISTHIWSKVIASTVWMIITAFVGIFIMMIVSIATNVPDSYHQIKIFMNERPAEARAIIIFLFEVLLLGVVYISRFQLKRAVQQLQITSAGSFLRRTHNSRGVCCDCSNWTSMWPLCIKPGCEWQSD